MYLIATIDSWEIIAFMLKSTILYFILSFSAFACSYFPPVHKVSRSFSVHMTNDVGPVVGLKLKVSRFKYKEYKRLSDEQRKSVDPKTFEQVIAESVTDSTGTAHFNLDRNGGFTLAPDTPASHLDWVELEVSDGPASSAVELKWPTTAILRTSQLRGRMTTGLMSSRSTPLKSDVLTLRSMVEYKEIASTTTSEDGKFEFGDVAPGLYFIHLAASPTETDPHYNEGNIAVYLAKDSSRETLAISTNYSSCGLTYDLEENKDRYKPLACFKGGKPIPCNY